MAEQALDRSQFRFFHRLRVRWAEVDLQKIVFNPHYLMYVDTALGDYWRALALPYEPSLKAMGGDLYVRKSTLEFHASAEYDDLLDVALRCARIGNSSLQLVSGIFRDEQLLVGAELVYVFADPVAKRALPVPAVLRDLLLGYEAGQSVVQTRIGSWGELQNQIKALRPSDGQDEAALHCVLTNALGEPVASARLLETAQRRPDALAVAPLLRGSGWENVAAQALLAGGAN